MSAPGASGGRVEFESRRDSRTSRTDYIRSTPRDLFKSTDRGRTNVEPDPTTHAVLTLAVDEGRRILAHLIEEIDRQKIAAERIARLGIAVLAGAIAAIGLLATSSLDLPVVANLGFALAILLNVAGVWKAATLLTFDPTPATFAIGPSLEMLEGQLQSAGWSTVGILGSMFHNYVHASLVNQASASRLATGSRTALWTLGGATLAYLAALGFIAGKVILHVE